MDKKESRRIAPLLSSLIFDFTTLMRQELRLFRAELSETGGRIGSGLSLVCAGGLLAFAGILILLDAAVKGLSRVLPFWLAALSIGGVAIFAGVILFRKGRNDLEGADLSPERGVQSLRRDGKWEWNKWGGHKNDRKTEPGF